MLHLATSVIADDHDDHDDETRGDRHPLQDVFQTEVVYPQGTGEVQLTLAPTFQHGQARDTFHLMVGIEYGLTNAWQVQCEWDAFVHQAPGKDNLSDVSLGTKYSFMNVGGTNLHAALQFEISLPAGDVNDELTEGFMEYEPSLMVAHDFPTFHNVQLFSQIGVGLVDRLKTPDDEDEKEPAAHEFFWSSGLFIPFHWGVVTAELTWTTNEWNNHGKEEQLFYTPGFVKPFPGGWEFGVGVPVGLTSRSDDIQVIGHLIYEF